MGEIVVLHPQSCFKNPSNNNYSLYPSMKSRRTVNLNHHHNPTNPSSDNRRQTPPQRILKDRNTPPSNNLVMGHVKILKRGELLEQTSTVSKPASENDVVGEREFIATKKKVTKHKMLSNDLLLSSTRRLGPDPGIVSKQMKMFECYAGFGFVESPSPSLVPLPTFSVKNH